MNNLDKQYQKLLQDILDNITWGPWNIKIKNEILRLEKFK